jgi:hypothetical protein
LFQLFAKGRQPGLSLSWDANEILLC